jgi:hypothetical protein
MGQLTTSGVFDKGCYLFFWLLFCAANTITFTECPKLLGVKCDLGLLRCFMMITPAFSIPCMSGYDATRLKVWVYKSLINPKVNIAMTKPPAA